MLNQSTIQFLILKKYLVWIVIGKPIMAVSLWSPFNNPKPGFLIMINTCKKQPMAYYTRHKLSKHPLYGKWSSMKARCNNRKDPGYKYYGKRNIKYFEDWEDFIPFYEWAIKNGYKKGLTLDRINNDGNYEPNNCRFTDHKTQANNKSNNINILYENKNYTIKEFCKEFNIPSNYIRSISYYLSINKSIDFIINRYKYV